VPAANVKHKRQTHSQEVVELRLAEGSILPRQDLLCWGFRVPAIWLRAMMSQEDFRVKILGGPGDRARRVFEIICLGDEIASHRPKPLG
jgi:hypothetical protein